MRRLLPLLLLSVLMAACGRAPTNTAEAEPPRINSIDVVKVVPRETTLAPGESGDVLVRLLITDGYHVNANPPSQSYLKATEIELKPQEGFSVEFITYPDPLVKSFSFSPTPLKVYEGETDLKLKLKADKSTTPGKHNLSAKLRVQACDDKVCYAPGAIDVIVPVNVK
ncbi:MAG TPA: protein-disulfide reductase DsbD domain-containing protein [Pyrinomonadaceae bacterium]|nr:protein-disulfide reductase DsbD domain-containing protein [Pyrinomonadaceae bacterium]